MIWLNLGIVSTKSSRTPRLKSCRQTRETWFGSTGNKIMLLVRQLQFIDCLRKYENLKKWFMVQLKSFNLILILSTSFHWILPTRYYLSANKKSLAKFVKCVNWNVASEAMLALDLIRWQSNKTYLFVNLRFWNSLRIDCRYIRIFFLRIDKVLIIYSRTVNVHYRYILFKLLSL